ncbi:hypothetical protein EV192_104224 [Actinocrispum wychmicini]|uniref:Uncharacterized protein n=1 Tax=Actinocrispum wychmicini TaxID=1213861 RepID=A0A4R2JHN9_9PSEU|nr:hypothetical protein EV192_104224 [Actinocrispum wychmicini]
MAERYTRGGPSAASGLPALNDAIAAMHEAYGYLQDGNDLRCRVARQLGWLLCMRRSFHPGKDEQDRETSIRLLEEAVAAPNLPENIRNMSQLQLGRFYVHQALQSLRAPNAPVRLMTGQAPPDVAA